MKKIAIILSLSALFAASFTTQAQDDRFAKWDKNSDGKVSVEEFTKKSKKKAKAIKKFEQLDTNSDGFLSEDEAAKMKKRNKKK
jgi:Ca2+-binding EF-hand superfamily protein